MSARTPEPCDVPSGVHEGTIRFFRTGWKCAAHAPRPQRISLPPPPACYEPTKLTPSQRDEIRRRVADGETAKDLAAEFRVSTRTIRQNS